VAGARRDLHRRAVPAGDGRPGFACLGGADDPPAEPVARLADAAAVILLHEFLWAAQQAIAAGQGWAGPPAPDPRRLADSLLWLAGADAPAPDTPWPCAT
jgi:hypothetical protein